MVWGFSCNRQRENGARYSHLIFNVRKINHCSKNTKHLKITGRLPQEPLQVYMMVFWKGCTKQEQRAQINRNMTILKKKKEKKKKVTAPVCTKQRNHDLMGIVFLAHV